MKKSISAFAKYILAVILVPFSATLLSAYTDTTFDPRSGIDGKLQSLSLRIRNPDPFVRADAAQDLGDIPHRKAVTLLIRVMGDESLYVRAYAAEALGKQIDARTFAPLLSAIADQEAYVRAFALEALGETGDSRAVEPLIAFLLSGRENSRVHAAWALGALGDERAVEPLIDFLKSPGTADVATEALQRITGCDLEPDYRAWRNWYEALPRVGNLKNR